MAIELHNVRYIYMKGSPFEHIALDRVTLTIEEGIFLAIAGHTGSGKSTLLQHLNGLLHPTEGEVLVDGVDLLVKKKRERAETKAAAQKVGMVFQYPEQQLFEETIAADIAFGPKNLGLTDVEVTERVKEAMAFMHLDYERLRERSPFSLSGGQMRRVAIAGVLALHPKYLILDEPTAGLDPIGREELIETMTRLHREKHTTILFVSHNMDDIAELADKVAILANGKVQAFASPKEAFLDKDMLAGAGLKRPEMMEICDAIRAAGIDLPRDVLTEDEAFSALMKAMKKRREE